ncbi:hypothetical protein CPB83DRAFT_174266 [Crepidotus variabilis]|uniref:Uncharacterized protein n=1 Tax=Crepidotus variabilis TaxID=179855 RepID=A0A9P6E3D2_9AGAR|nr:hypothetical protein CPB83DRAFT_174266 [Crepidotus variabilis]
MVELSNSSGKKKTRKIHPGEALGILPSPTPHKNKNTRRYKRGNLDAILRVRGRLRNAFPGLSVTKPAIRAAYKKAGWPTNEIDWATKREIKVAREHEEAARETYMNAF